jgi:hypothetical protein
MLMHAASNAATGWLTTLLKDTQLVTPTMGWVAYIVDHGWIRLSHHILVVYAAFIWQKCERL